jgi:hypothetical protein
MIAAASLIPTPTLSASGHRLRARGSSRTVRSADDFTKSYLSLPSAAG